MQIKFSNEYHNGQMTVELISQDITLRCHGHVTREGNLSVIVMTLTAR